VDWQTLLLALGLVFILEGVGYAAFPAQMKRFMRQLTETPIEKLRVIGFVAILVGLVVFWFVSR